MWKLRPYLWIGIILVVCLLVIGVVQPAQADRSAQTVPTAGPSHTPATNDTPDPGANPPPTAILATSPVGGVQPTRTPTLTQTLPAGATPLAETPPVETATSQPTIATEAPPDPTATAQAMQATLTLLPTLPTAVSAREALPGGAWCFPIGVLILGGLVLFLSKRFIRRERL
jgi:hypothetical protein